MGKFSWSGSRITKLKCYEREVKLVWPRQNFLRSLVFVLTSQLPRRSGEVTKFGRNDSTSPAPPTSLAAPQPPQAQSQGQSQAPQPQPPQAQPQGQPQHHSNQQAFLPPGYSYTGLPYYAGVPGAIPSAAAFQYGPTMFVPPGGPGPASAKQHSMGLGLGNPSASPFQQQTQQQPGGYGQHTFSSGQ